MRKFLFIMCLLLIYFNSYSQFYAGYHLFSYVDIIPDTLINYIVSPTYNSEEYSIDINADSLKDFKIKAVYSYAMGGTTSFITVTSLNANSSVIFGRFDSTNTTCCGLWVDAVAKPLSYGDSLNSKTATWYGTTLTLTDDSRLGIIPGDSKNITDWIDSNDKYIGLKYQTISDTIYGWIRVNCPYFSNCDIKDYSYGSLTSGIIENFFDAKINIHPNPAKNSTRVDYTLPNGVNEGEIVFYDLKGKEIKRFKVDRTFDSLLISTADLPAGTYYYQLQTTNNASEGKKMVVVK